MKRASPPCAPVSTAVKDGKIDSASSAIFLTAAEFHSGKQAGERFENLSEYVRDGRLAIRPPT